MGRNPIGNALWKPDATNTSRNPWHLLRCERAWPEFNIWIGTRVSDRSPDPLCAKIPHFCGAFQQPPGSTPRLKIHVDEPAPDIVSPSKAIPTVGAPARRQSVDGGVPFFCTRRLALNRFDREDNAGPSEGRWRPIDRRAR